MGHNNVLNSQTIDKIKNKYKSKFALWYEDHLIKGGPNAVSNLKLIEENNELIDQYFVTTYPSSIKTIIPKNKLNFMPIPSDYNIENLDIFTGSGPEFSQLFKLRGLPTTILIDRNGFEVGRIVGYIDFNDQSLLDWLAKNL